MGGELAESMRARLRQRAGESLLQRLRSLPRNQKIQNVFPLRVKKIYKRLGHGAPEVLADLREIRTAHKNSVTKKVRWALDLKRENGTIAAMMTDLLSNVEPMKKVAINPKERFGAHLRFTVDEYSYIAKLAKLSRHGSMQKVIRGMFPRTWERDHAEATEKVKKLGYRERDFFPPGLLKRMGIKIKPGPRGKLF